MLWPMSIVCDVSWNVWTRLQKRLFKGVEE